MLHIKLKGMIYALTWYKYTSLDPDVRSKDQNLTFSEHGHVAYQIKGNEAQSKMQANIQSK